MSEYKCWHSIVFEIQTHHYGKLTEFNKPSTKIAIPSLVLQSHAKYK